ncbi:MAG: iron-containing alcohol dehydrogenase, partial [Vicinamibacteria bacterium]
MGALAQELRFRRTLIVSDPGVVRSGHFESASKELRDVGIEVFGFHDFDEDPDTRMVESGRDVASQKKVDSLVGLGGGSSMDCAKGINFLLTNGGTMKDYWGIGKASKPMLPSIGIPTTA